MKNPDLADKLKNHFASNALVTTSELTNSIHEHFPELSQSTIAWKINQLTKDGLLFRAGRGVYSFSYKPEFPAELGLKAKRLYTKVKSVYSQDVVLWDTTLLNEIGDSSVQTYLAFLSVPKEMLNSLFEEMKNFSKPVYLQPDKEITDRYVINQQEAIILTPLISETPVKISGDYITPTLEGILVNAWFDHEQFLEPIGFQITSLFKHAFTKYNINTSKLLRYAARRDKRKEIKEIIKAIE